MVSQETQGEQDSLPGQKGEVRQPRRWETETFEGLSQNHDPAVNFGPFSENAKNTLCRNVTIYGHCRFEDKGWLGQQRNQSKADWILRVRI